MSTCNQWTAEFQRIYHAALEKYRNGADNSDKILIQPDIDYLKKNGIKPINIFDYIEDVEKYGEPDYGTALLLASARREYFLLRQNGNWEEATVTTENLPPKTDSVDGIEWLPRIMPKARAFLAGRAVDDLMYCCGGDRRFFTTNNVNPIDFLRVVDAAGDDDQQVIDYVKQQQATA